MTQVGRNDVPYRIESFDKFKSVDSSADANYYSTSTAKSSTSAQKNN